MPRRYIFAIIAVIFGFLVFAAGYHVWIWTPQYAENVLSPKKWMVLFLVVPCTGLFLYYKFHPQVDLSKIRRLPGLDNMEPIVQCAAETGKPVLFIFGQLSLTAMSNIAALEYLRGLARLCIRYNVHLYVIAREGTLIAGARDVSRWAAEMERRPDLFNRERIFLLSPDQFSFAMSAAAKMFRLKPAGVFCYGYFRAESLLLLESARASGATVIAATDEPTQMPFLIACAHFPLIGEELYAAGALSGDSPVLRASVRVQDVWRLITIGLIIGGAIFKMLAVNFEWQDAIEFLATFPG